MRFGVVFPRSNVFGEHEVLGVLQSKLLVCIDQLVALVDVISATTAAGLFSNIEYMKLEVACAHVLVGFARQCLLLR